MSDQPNVKGYVLLSGGADSGTALTFAVNQLGQKNIRCVSIDYGQRHSKEIGYAKKLADFYGRNHEVLDLSGIIPKTLLTDPSQDIPRVGYADLPHGVSPSFVPYRNGLMLSSLTSHIVGNLKEDEEALLYFGPHLDDASRYAYPDCTFEFVGAQANAIHVGTYYKVRLVTPWLFMTKDEIISYGAKHGTPYYLTWSCYVGGEKHCGSCMTCRSRKEAFEKSGVIDPTEYEE